MTTETLWTDPASGWRVTRADTPSRATLALLSRTVWGSRASRYRILNVAEKLGRLREPSFFVLEEGGAELAVMVLDKCTKRVAGRPCGACHFAMVATVPGRRNQGLAGRLLDHVRAYCLATVGAPGFGFAYVETTTEFSLRMSDRIGHAVEADLPLMLFTRLAPRVRPGARGLRPEEADTIRTRLEALYAGHELADFDTSLRVPDYAVQEEGGRIVAGAQAEALRWSLVEVPGSAGWTLLTLWPRLPLARRVLNPADLTILRLGNLWVEDGQEVRLARLLETLLARHRARIGLILLDARSPVYARLRDRLPLGVLAGALKGSAKLRIDVVGMEDDMVQALSSRPLLVSPADVF